MQSKKTRSFFRMASQLLGSTLLFAFAACAHKAVAPQRHAEHGDKVSISEAASGAQMLTGLGNYERPITTKSKEAQDFFNQGLSLYYAFNHDEAFRSFAKSTELDPECASCFWGVSLTLGPNYNMPMLGDHAATAWEARQQALALSSNASEIERGLINALAVRYTGPELPQGPAQEKANRDYAQAMGSLAQRFPNDVDVQALYAESLMNLNPWKLWSLDGKAGPDTAEIVAVLERGLVRSPLHPGLNHFYIHSIEASKRPEKALPSAKRLKDLMPEAGHLVHMPAHIFQRVGNYSQAAEANRQAIAADQRYNEEAKPRGYYLPMYSSHNYLFLAYATAMEGKSNEAIWAARQGAELMTPETLKAMPTVEFYLSQPIMMLTRFGRWDEVLVEQAPLPQYKVATGLWLHARGLAHLAQNETDKAQALAGELEKLRSEVPAEQIASMNKAQQILDIAFLVLKGKIAEKRGHITTAITDLEKAVAQEDQLAYMEPPDWWVPVRHVLGDVLVRAGKGAQAEKVYIADLRAHPRNGWALAGLAQAKRVQGKNGELPELEIQIKDAWAQADTQATGSWVE